MTLNLPEAALVLMMRRCSVFRRTELALATQATATCPGSVSRSRVSIRWSAVRDRRRLAGRPQIRGRRSAATWWPLRCRGRGARRCSAGRTGWTFRIVFAVSGLHTCGWHPARLQSWSRLRAARAARRSTTTSPATTAVRPCRRTTSPSSARAARACCSVATRTSCRVLISWTEGSDSPAASIPELASRRGLLEQLAELDQRRPFGLTGFPAAGSRGPSADRSLRRPSPARSR